MTAVYGGPKSLIDRVVLRCMFGTTSPMFDGAALVTEYRRNPDLAEYVRWEYPAVDWSSVFRSMRRPPKAPRRRMRFAAASRIGRRLRIWAEALRDTPSATAGSSLVKHALPREKVL